ncbi:ferric reductase like transmembrane component [Ophiostoma piceae UAMH 11346]|uniref:ferric-chelate reductase (NADPH) n=1 Tax=Ophiostoma piceae (strain UAMH 11346) TaxID=1262450 RepID=S3CNQ4_OPHP1|nr:ferric reductase like transmembrane component [Ophiostoma piceae UAMH 11346]
MLEDLLHRLYCLVLVCRSHTLFVQVRFDHLSEPRCYCQPPTITRMNNAPAGSPAQIGAAAGGHGQRDPAKAAIFALRHHYNEMAAEYFAASVCGIIGLFVFLHWTRQLVHRSGAVPSALRQPSTVVSRVIRNILVRGTPGFSSTGHGLLVAIYVAVNLSLLLTNVDKTILSPIASRLGWLLMSNMCFVVFLALKNTPLAYLTSYSYERLNCLHQIAGCTTFFLMVVHAAAYTAFFYQRGKPEVLREDAQVAGIVAGFMFTVMVASALLLRRYAYEVFYVLHVAAFLVAIVCIGLHRPDIKTRVPVVTCLTASLFIADRVLRFGRLLVNCTSNEATLYPLPGGGTRILLTKTPCRSVPGKHVFVWIPRIRLLETHPFTIIDANTSQNGTGTELVVKSYSGFTRQLHEYAAAHPGARLWAACEGPYGTFPDPIEYDKVVLVAGGSGASYTLGLAVSMLERMDAQSTKNIVFIWTAKTIDSLTWYAKHLDTLQSHAKAPQVHVSLHVTRVPGSSDDDARRGRPVVHREIEKKADNEQTEGANVHGSGTDTPASTPLRHPFSPGRPDAAAVIREAVSSTARSQRVLVAACGPPSLMTTVRNATAQCITSDGPSIELHCEQFGW